MSGELQPTLPHRPGEAPASFLSRLGALHRVGAREFCRDMGFSFQAVIDGCTRTLAALAALAGVPASKLCAEAIQKADSQTYRYKGETLVRQTLRRSRVMACALCLKEDVSSGPARISAYGRTYWTLDPIRTCPIHACTLMQIAHVEGPAMLHDFAANVAPALAQLPQLVCQVRRRPTSSLETYLVDRLEGRVEKTTSWLNALDWHVASDVCHLLGAVGLHGRDVMIASFEDDDWYAAGDAGFVVAASGPEGIIALLKHLDDTYPRSRIATEGPQAVFGQLFKRIAFGLQNPGFDPLRHVLHDYVAATRPFGPGDKMFGRPFERVRHSIRSASLEYKIHPLRLRKILEAKGLVAKGNSEPDERTLFDAEAAKGLLEKSASALSLTNAETYLNAGRVHTRLLMEKGFIKPFVIIEGRKTGEFNFAKSTLDRFLRRLDRGAITVKTEDPDAFTIPQAAKRANCGAAEIVMLIVRRQLEWVGKLEEKEGYMAVRVRLDEIKHHVHGKRPPGKTAREVEKTLGTRTATVSALVAAGHLITITTINPVNRCALVLIPDHSLSKFRETYVSLFELSELRGVHFRRVKADLAARDIQPALDAREIGATFYRRSDTL